MTRHNSCRVSPFGNPRITARLTAPRGISQPPTSFIGSQCQGIHHAPLNTYNTKNQKMRKNHTTTNHTPPTRPHNRGRISRPPTTTGQKPNACGLMLATTIHKSNTTPHHQAGRQQKPPTILTHNTGDKPGQARTSEASTNPQRGRPASLLPQDPTVCLVTPKR